MGVRSTFKVIDLSFSLQMYRANEQRYLNGYVLVEECEQPAEETNIEDLMENEAKEEFVRVYRRAPTMADLPQIGFGSIVQFIADFSSCKTTKDQVRLKYTPTKISAAARVR